MRAARIAVVPLLIGSAIAQRATLRIPESSEPVRISLQNIAPNKSGFTSILIRANGQTVTFHPRNAIACAQATKEERKGDITWAEIEGMRLDDSLCFYVGDFGEGSAKHTLLAFRSEGGASDAAPVFVIGFKADGTPYKVLERDEFDLTSLTTSPDGSALLIGKPTLSQVMAKIDYDSRKDPYATTYDPYAVYVIGANQPAAYSLQESRVYNLQHYVWAGPKSSEEYSVLYNIPGHIKPFVLTDQKANEALKRAERERKQ